MKRLLLLLFLCLCSCLSAAPLLNILQVEYIRNGGYRPQSKLPYTDLTASATAQFASNYSDHASQVASLWQANGTAALVAHYYVCESTNFEINSLRAAKTFDPLPAQWHLVILPYGSSATWSIASATKLALQCERDNVLALVSPPDAGQGYFPFPCNAKSPNIIHVASSTTGSFLTNEVAPELYFPYDWNSYAEPEIISNGLGLIFDWLLQNQVQYKAGDIKQILLATAQLDAQGRRMFNGGAALAAVKAKYGPPIPTPPPLPTPTPVPTPVPTPTPAPTADDLRAAAAKSVGASYDAAAKTFLVPADEVQQLDKALQAAGL